MRTVLVTGLCMATACSGSATTAHESAAITTVAATPLLTMKIPAPAQAMPNPPVGEFSIAAIGYVLPDLHAEVLVQRDVLDGDCASYLAFEQKAWLAQLADPAGKERLQLEDERATIDGMQTLLSTGRQHVGERWFSIAVLATCKGPESLVMTVSSTTSDDAKSVAQLRTIVVHAAETLQSSAKNIAPARVAASSTLGMLLPQPSLLVEEAGESSGIVSTRTYKMPGVAGFSVSELRGRSAPECDDWLEQTHRDLTQGMKEQTRDSKMLDEMVDRSTAGDTRIVFRIGRQLASTGSHQGEWYANVAGALCRGGTPLVITAVSFDGSSTVGTIPDAVKARLRARITDAAASLAPI